MEYLDSLNDYRKRSRSREDEAFGQKKIAKTGSGYLYGHHDVHGELGMPDGKVEADSVMVDEVVPEGDPFVYGWFCLFVLLLTCD